MNIFLISELIERVGITFGLGASTFALIFFFKAMEDKIIDPSEKNFMHAVYFVLRMGMTLILVSLLTMLLYSAYTGTLATMTTMFFFKGFLFAVILVNALLMDKKLMPMNIGPALAGGSWYSFFIATLVPVLPIWILLGSYTVFIIFFIFLLKTIKRVYLDKKPIM